jgi:hypothetical protein
LRCVLAKVHGWGGGVSLSSSLEQPRTICGTSGLQWAVRLNERGGDRGCCWAGAGPVGLARFIKTRLADGLDRSSKSKKRRGGVRPKREVERSPDEGFGIASAATPDRHPRQIAGILFLFFLGKKMSVGEREREQQRLFRNLDLSLM